MCYSHVVPKPISLWCKTCSEFTCATCIVVHATHPGHSIQSLSQIRDSTTAAAKQLFQQLDVTKSIVKVSCIDLRLEL